MDLIGNVMFPEMMTWFLMQKEATYAIYNKERKRTIFHNILLEEVRYTSSLSLARMQSFQGNQINSGSENGPELTCILSLK